MRAARAITGAAAIGAVALALAPAGALAGVKFTGKTDEGSKITFVKEGKKIKRVSTLLWTNCFENGGSYGIKSGWELFKPSGSFVVGKSITRKETKRSAITGDKHQFRHTVEPKVRKRNGRFVASGKLSLAYQFSEYDWYTNQISFWYCSGQAKFKAKQA